MLITCWEWQQAKKSESLMRPSWTAYPHLHLREKFIFIFFKSLLFRVFLSLTAEPNLNHLEDYAFLESNGERGHRDFMYLHVFPVIGFHEVLQVLMLQKDPCMCAAAPYQHVESTQDQSLRWSFGSKRCRQGGKCGPIVKWAASPGGSDGCVTKITFLGDSLRIIRS